MLNSKEIMRKVHKRICSASCDAFGEFGHTTLLGLRSSQVCSTIEILVNAINEELEAIRKDLKDK